MTIKIKDCNNIASAEVELLPSRLNIKYALNGTGKSTIARAIAAFVNHDEEEKKSLVPFKYANAPEPQVPEARAEEELRPEKTSYNKNFLEQGNR